MKHRDKVFYFRFMIGRFYRAYASCSLHIDVHLNKGALHFIPDNKEKVYIYIYSNKNFEFVNKIFLLL